MTARSRSQDSSVPLPLLFQLSHPLYESRIFPEMVQIGIIFKQRMTGKTVIRRRLQPIDGLLSLFHHRISASDVISGMVKVAEALSPFHRASDLGLSLILAAVQGCDQGLDARKQSYVCMPRIIFQELFDYGRRFVSSSKMQ